MMYMISGKELKCVTEVHLFAAVHPTNDVVLSGWHKASLLSNVPLVIVSCLLALGILGQGMCLHAMQALVAAQSS